MRCDHSYFIDKPSTAAAHRSAAGFCEDILVLCLHHAHYCAARSSIKCFNQIVFIPNKILSTPSYSTFPFIARENSKKIYFNNSAKNGGLLPSTAWHHSLNHWPNVQRQNVNYFLPIFYFILLNQK
jgi:hypothetical protein